MSQRQIWCSLVLSLLEAAGGKYLCSYESREIASAASVFALLMLLLALEGHCIQIVHALLIIPECCVLDLAFSFSQHFSYAEAKGAVLTDLRKVRI